MGTDLEMVLVQLLLATLMGCMPVQQAQKYMASSSFAKKFILKVEVEV